MNRKPWRIILICLLFIILVLLFAYLLFPKYNIGYINNIKELEDKYNLCYITNFKSIGQIPSFRILSKCSLNRQDIRDVRIIFIWQSGNLSLNSRITRRELSMTRFFAAALLTLRYSTPSSTFQNSVTP